MEDENVLEEENSLDGRGREQILQEQMNQYRYEMQNTQNKDDGNTRKLFQLFQQKKSGPSQ